MAQTINDVARSITGSKPSMIRDSGLNAPTYSREEYDRMEAAKKRKEEKKAKKARFPPCSRMSAPTTGHAWRTPTPEQDEKVVIKTEDEEMEDEKGLLTCSKRIKREEPEEERPAKRIKREEPEVVRGYDGKIIKQEPEH